MRVHRERESLRNPSLFWVDVVGPDDQSPTSCAWDQPGEGRLSRSDFCPAAASCWLAATGHVQGRCSDSSLGDSAERNYSSTATRFRLKFYRDQDHWYSF